MTLFLRLVTLVFVALTAACGGGGGTEGAAEPTARVLLARTDARTCGFEHVYVTVNKIQFYRSAESADAGSGAAEVILSPPRRIDLVTLSDGVLEELGASPLPAGHYTHLRLVLAANSEGAAATLANAVQPMGGSLMPLDTPSAPQSGLKLQVDFEVMPGQMADLVLDFNACLSVVKAGNSGNYILRPVVSARPRVVMGNSERQVNTTTVGAQVQPHAAKLSNGGHAIVWASPVPGAGSIGIYAQRYAADGTPAGGETRISTNTATDQVLPAVAALTGGGYVIAWASLDSSGSGAGRGLGIYVRRFAADGTPVGAEQQVNTASMFEHTAPHVAGLAGGGYVVTWTFVQSTDAFPGSIPGVFARRYTAGGTPAGPEQVVSSVFGLTDSAVAALGDGGYVVGWSVTSKTRVYVYMRRFNAVGVAAGSATLVSDWGETPAVTGLKAGGYLVTWHSLDGFIQAQRYNADGSPGGPEIRVDPAVGQQNDPSAAALDDGGYVVAWVASHGDSSGKDVYARRYAADGSAAGSIARINQTTASDQVSPTVTAAAAGGFAVTWMSLNQDGDSWGIYERRFDAQGLL